MADPPGDFTPYNVTYSSLVLDEFAALFARARIHGGHQLLVNAARTVHHRLRVYPQFGEPLRDSAVERAQEWIGAVPPLVVNYIICEERRLVCVVKPLAPLPRSGH